MDNLLPRTRPQPDAERTPGGRRTLRCSFALTALAEQESINVDDKAEAKLEEERDPADAIDLSAFAVMDDLIQDS